MRADDDDESFFLELELALETLEEAEDLVREEGMVAVADLDRRGKRVAFLANCWVSFVGACSREREIQARKDVWMMQRS